VNGISLRRCAKTSGRGSVAYHERCSGRWTADRLSISSGRTIVRTSWAVDCRNLKRPAVEMVLYWRREAAAYGSTAKTSKYFLAAACAYRASRSCASAAAHQKRRHRDGALLHSSRAIFAHASLHLLRASAIRTLAAPGVTYRWRISYLARGAQTMPLYPRKRDNRA